MFTVIIRVLQFRISPGMVRVTWSFRFEIVKKIKIFGGVKLSTSRLDVRERTASVLLKFSVFFMENLAFKFQVISGVLSSDFVRAQFNGAVFDKCEQNKSVKAQAHTVVLLLFTFWVMTDMMVRKSDICWRLKSCEAKSSD